MSEAKKPASKNVAVTTEDKHEAIMRKAKMVVDAHMVANDGYMNVGYLVITHEGVTYRVKVRDHGGDMHLTVIQPETHIAGSFYTRPEGCPVPGKILTKESLPDGWASLDNKRG